MGEQLGSFDMAALAAAADGKIIKKVGGVWVDVDEAGGGPAVLPWTTTHTGEGTKVLTLNAVNRYDNGLGDEMTLQIPANPADADEVWLCEIGGSDELVTLDANTKVASAWYSLGGVASIQELRYAALYAGWKFIASLGTWKSIGYRLDLNFNPPPAIGSGFKTLGPMQDSFYDGSGTLTYQFPDSSFIAPGATISVTEHEGLATGTMTMDQNPNSLDPFVNSANASATTEAFSTAFIHREWKWDAGIGIWLPTARVN